MNYAHLHLLLNHIPVLGTIFGVGLFLFSFVGKNEDLRRASYILFIACALLTIPTFMSGFGARAMIKGPGVSDALMSRHAGAALVSLWMMMLTGAFALIGLWLAQTTEQPPHWNVMVVLVLSLLTVAFMARTGNTGGDIRHPEARPTGELVAGQDTVHETGISALFYKVEPDPQAFSDWMTFSKWFWTFMMASHYIGLILIVGTVGIFDLRIMGFIKQIPIAPLHRFLPYGLIGLAINITTGLMAFAGRPDNFVFSSAIWLKMGALMLLGANAALFYMTDVFGEVKSVKAGENAPISARLIAASSLILWFVVIAMGRYIQPLTDTLLPTN